MKFTDISKIPCTHHDPIDTHLAVTCPDTFKLWVYSVIELSKMYNMHVAADKRINIHSIMRSSIEESLTDVKTLIASHFGSQPE